MNAAITNPHGVAVFALAVFAAPVALVGVWLADRRTR